MTDTDDPFADLESGLENDQKSGTSETTEQDESRETAPDVQRPDPIPDSNLSDPAFSFDVTKQDPLYARPESWERFNDTLLEVELALRDCEIRDVPKRELHDAALRVLTNHTDEFVEAVVDERRDNDV
ncbi:hypothetical protein GJR96_07070 [Haloferax sp. MBLA0076]|uniref:Uncharacterized protein n=1 Tax=Haloferax litoreum TaxID=2666140 RepID=A0A6A8GFS0_9EURY|nr:MULTISPECIES: hypothetical protein [Haloferax]KAB1193218.1 hypothetical protein Hfx1148_07060 [Haloferax sp. CBA1148]MRX21716.1 hypothetical protein [Haloferax litoreum]